MKCILEKLVPREHKNITDARYAESFVNCSLFDGKQICFWCCLHIRDIAEPLRRGDYSLEHPEYEALIPKESNRESWDIIWQTCNKCSKT